MSSNVRIEYDVQNVGPVYNEGDDEEYVEWEYDIHHIESSDDDKYCSLTTPIDVEVGKHYYILYVLYDIGDSLYTENRCLDFVDIYETENDAIAIKTMIDGMATPKKDKEMPNFVNIYNGRGERYQYTFPWSVNDYFGGFNKSHIVKLECKL